MAGGPITHPPATTAPSGAPQSLRERLEAMAAKHKADGTDSLSQATQPEPPAATSPEEAVAMLRAGLGPMAWERTYLTMTDDATGQVTYIDTETGEALPSIPTGDPYTGPAT